MWLQYPSVSADLYLFVVGRAAAGALTHVQVERTDGAWKSAEELVSEDGSFVVQVELRPRQLTTLRLVGRAPDGAAVVLEPSEVTIRHGISLADPPLSRTIGVALADGGVSVYFERGAPLPSRKTFRLKTSISLKPGTVETAISVPIVQGEAAFARLCRLVGTIGITPDALTAPLPAGSPVDVVLELDRAGRLTAMAHLPDQKVTFPGKLVLVSPDAVLEELEPHLGRLRAEVEALHTDPQIPALARTRLLAVDARLSECEQEVDAARSGDADSLEKLRRMLLDADAQVNDIAAEKTWPELERKAENEVSFAIEWASRTGSEMDRRTLDDAVRSLHRARAAKDVVDFGRRLGNIVRLGEACWIRNPEVLADTFRSVSGRVGEMRDPRAAQKHVNDGALALGRQDFDALRRSTYALFGLLPPREEVRMGAHGSGVER